MMRSNRVKWSEVDRDTYEDMVAVLISRLHPTAQRIDGSGGDGGRDVLVPLDTGLEIYQLKSHTGRVRGSRRTEIKNSLARAAEHEPVAWYLVVPVDPTPGELEWFEQLTTEGPFPCRWMGKTWLDSHMADMPELRRYYLENARDEIIELIERLNMEGTALGDGVQGAIERFRAIQDELNQTDPHYTFHMASQVNGAIKVTIRPRYRGADRDRPMHLRPVFSFPDTPEGRRMREELQASIDFGMSCTIPAEFIERVQLDLPAGLGGEYIEGSLSLGSSSPENPGDETMELRILNRDQTILNQLSLKRTNITYGERGPRRTFVDTSSAITAFLQVDLTQEQVDCTFQFSQPDEYSPPALLPAVRLLASLSTEAIVAVVINGEHVCDSAIDPSSQFVQEAQGYANLLEALSFLQLTTGIDFFIRGDLTHEEVKALDVAVRLLRGEALQSTWTEHTISMTREMYETAVMPYSIHQLSDRSSLRIKIQNQTIPIGSVMSERESAYLLDTPQELPDDPNEVLQLTFVPADSNIVTHRLQHD